MRYWIMKDSMNKRYVWDDKAKEMFKVVNSNEVLKVNSPADPAKFVPTVWLVEKTNKKPSMLKDF